MDVAVACADSSDDSDAGAQEELVQPRSLLAEVEAEGPEEEAKEKAAEEDARAESEEKGEANAEEEAAAFARHCQGGRWS